MFKKFYEAIAHPIEPIPNPRPRLEMAIKWLMFTATIMLLGLMSAYYPIQANIPFIVIPSFLCLLFAKPVLFEKMKLTTLVVVRTFCVLCVCLPMINGFSMTQFYVDLVQLALVVNILEATFTDLLRHKKYFNAVSGFFLALGTIGLKGHWLQGAAANPVGLNYYLVFGATNGATICYIIGYTIWNWIFVTDEFSPSVSLMHVGFLLSPIIGCLAAMAGGIETVNPFGLWLLLRANTLSIGGWLQISCKHWFEREFYDEKFAKFIEWVHSTPVQIICMLACIGLMLGCIIPAFTIGGYNPFGFQLEPWIYGGNWAGSTMPANW